jgi:GT2 family glycosyltransferase
MKKTSSISVVIPFSKNNYGLIYTLATLQNQTVKPSRIIIIDTSKKKAGLMITRIFSYNDIPIFVEVCDAHIYSAWNKGIDLCKKPGHILFINDDVLMPVDFIESLEKSIKNVTSYAHVPMIPNRSYSAFRVSGKFDSYSEDKQEYCATDWLAGFCFLLTDRCIKDVGKFDDKKYTIWFGDDDYQDRIEKKAKENNIRSINKLKNIYVYHYGGKSYDYKNEEIQKIIDKDRKNYKLKSKKT